MTEAELLFTHILNCDRASLYLDRALPLDRGKALAIAGALERRARFEPIQYILGKVEFMGLEFKVAPGVLIPRPETEILVETAIRFSGYPDTLIPGYPQILDIGTGSGCIAVSLAKNLANADIAAVDISDSALEIAAQNARLNNVDNIRFIQGDLFPPSTFHLSPFALIISNPPYIPTAEIDNLQPELIYEPRIALDGGRDGLEFYRRIIEEAPRRLKACGFLIMEIGCGQAPAVKNIAQNSGKFKIIEVVKDYSQIERVIVLKNLES